MLQLTKILRSVFTLAIGCAGFVCAQPASAQQGYGAYYQQNAPRGAGLNVNRYLYNQYFYNRPSVSPYMNLSRRAPDGMTTYQAYVRPEQQRRQNVARQQASSISARKQQGHVGGMPDYLQPGQPKRQPTALYNQWYGTPANR